MIITKLHKPEPISRLVIRKELLEKLEKGKDRRLTLVSAPAGYGRSTIIIRWLGSTLYGNIDRDNDGSHFLRDQNLDQGSNSKW